MQQSNLLHVMFRLNRANMSVAESTMALDPPISIPLTVLPSHDCNYLPGRPATMRAFRVDRIPGEVYHRFMDAGFRRTGTVIYQPVCEGCSACVQIRVPVDRFKPNRSQRRSRARNADLRVSVGPPVLTDEKLSLYSRYITQWHGQEPGSGEIDRQNLQSFLYESPVDTLEFCYRDSTGQLLGVGICDICRQSLSAVYFYFDPDQSRRSLGTFSALIEIDFARECRIPFYYLGFWVDGCKAMKYKSSFNPCQVIAESGEWREFPEFPVDQMDAR
jgi:arginine-tRNA-protein transferase